MYAHRRAGFRRLLVGVACLGALGALLVTGASTAVAAADITGKVRAVVDYDTRPPLVGQTVRLWTNDEGDPGTLVDTDVTNDNGNFAVTPPRAGGYFLQLVGPNYRNGWLNEQGYFWRRSADTVLVRPGDDLTPTYAIPTFVRGRVVNQATGNPVDGVVVTAVQAGSHEFLARDRSNDRGVFRIEDVVPNDDTIELKFNGSEVGYESGWSSCFGTVVPTSGEGCAVGLGATGTWRIQRD